MVILWKFREIHFMAVVVADLKMVVLRWNKKISLVNCKKIPAWWLVAAAACLKFFLSLFFVLIKSWNIVFLLLPLKPFYLPWYQLGRISNYKPEKTFVLTFKPFSWNSHKSNTELKSKHHIDEVKIKEKWHHHVAVSILYCGMYSFIHSFYTQKCLK